jgi:uncharacterized protein
LNVEPYIETSIGRKFYLLAEHPGFEITEIAHALSHACRYGGHCSQFYSVAEHSVLVSEIAEELKLCDPFEALMHDASEAYIVDIPGPWKCLLPDYQKLEADLERKLQAFFGLPPKTAGCKAADLVALMVEGRALLTSRGETMIEGGIPFGYAVDADQWIAAHGKSIFGLSPAGARTSFMHRYEKLTRKRK